MSLEKVRNRKPQSKGFPQEREAPLPYRRQPRRSPSQGPEKSRLENLFKRHPGLNFDQNTGFQGGPSAKRKGYKLALWSILAFTIDMLVLMALSCVFILAFSSIVSSPLKDLVGSFAAHQGLFFVQVMIVAAWGYMIAMRGFMGASLGEWACDLRLGQPHERLGAFYVLRVAVRVTLILLSGVILLPLLSLLFGRDLAGVLSGIKLFSLK